MTREVEIEYLVRNFDMYSSYIKDLKKKLDEYNKTQQAFTVEIWEVTNDIKIGDKICWTQNVGMDRIEERTGIITGFTFDENNKIDKPLIDRIVNPFVKLEDIKKEAA